MQMDRSERMLTGMASDKGMLRQRNEDSCAILTGEKGIPDVFVIADGMGGHSSGETASKLAVDHVIEYIRMDPSIFSKGDGLPERLVSMMRNTHRLVLECSQTTNAWKGMGTTLTVAVLLESDLYVGHVGDSRLYILDSSGFRRITSDHSYTEELIRSGKLTREQARHHPNKNMITRAIGGLEDEVEVDTFVCSLENGSHMLLCTDGLTNEVDERTIQEIILAAATPQDACDQLVHTANQNGGRDNITAVILRCDDD
ncbi:MAG TPA: Stp1/IreP family PP2C-type Ser/Thr phosphatase [Clostridiales bacterium]|nr:Stp1/IreP family PP2C-type Ser/Thr phosphatase [Clostridiales bacterium]